MSKHLGDYDAGNVIYGKFSTYQPSTGAAFALAGTPALSVYKDNSTTQSTAGITLTASFDSVTGLNHFTIDTSADGSFYADGSNFDIVITTGTVDSVSVVGTVVASFTLRKSSALKPTTAARTLDVASTGEAGIDFANVNLPVGAVPALGILDNGTAQAATSTTLQLRSAATFGDDTIIGAIVLAFGSTQGYWQVRQITDYVSSTDTATVDAWQVTPSGTITYLVIAAPPALAALPAVNVTQVDGAALDTHDAGSFPADVRSYGGTAGTFSGGRPEVNVSHAAGTAWNSGGIGAATLAADTITAAKIAADAGTEIATAVWASATRTLTALDEDDTTIDLDAAIRAAIGMAAANLDTQIGTLATASVLATVATYLDTEIAAIMAVTDKLDTTLQPQSGSAGYQFTEIALALAGAGGGLTVQDIVDGVWDEPMASHLSGGSTGASLNGAGSAGDPWTTALPGAYGAGTAGNIVGNNLDALISTRAAASALATVDTVVDAIQAKTDNLPTDPADESLIIAATDAIMTRLGAPAGVSVSADVAAVKTQTAAIEVDTQDIQGRLPAALVGGRMDASAGAMAANVITAASTAADYVTEVQNGLATAAALATVGGNVDAILVDTAEIGVAGAGLTALASAANLATVATYIDTEVAAIKAKTDSLTFTVAGKVDANTLYVNGTQVGGNGQPGTEWGPA
jgi:hypothetical protein